MKLLAKILPLILLMLIPASNRLADTDYWKADGRRAYAELEMLQPLVPPRLTAHQYIAQPDLKIRNMAFNEASTLYYIPEPLTGLEKRNAGELEWPLQKRIRNRNAGNSDEYYKGFSRIPGFRLFSFHFDNDIYGNTDYYYTNGVSFSLVHPALSHFPTAKILLPDLHNSSSYFGVQLVQNIYTPIDPDQHEIQFGDRPFAGYFYVGFFRTQVHPVKGVRLTSSLDLGIIGPAALGGYVQKAVHQIEPVGWENQVSNDFILNYNIATDKALRSGRNFQWAAIADARLGTLYTDLTIGTALRTGNHFYQYEFLSPLEYRTGSFTWFVEGEAAARIVGYDASLQGGMFNKTSIHTISPKEINRLVWQAALGVGSSYRFVSLTLKHHFLSPEFEGGKSHMWGRISLAFKL